MLPIPREKRNNRLTNLLIFVLVPVFIFACKRARATFFFQFLRHGHMGSPFSIFKTWAYGLNLKFFYVWDMTGHTTMTIHCYTNNGQ